MELSHEFRVRRPLAEVWPALIDLGAVAAALPGASLEDVESDGTRQGRFRIKLGSFVASFRGRARYVSVDEDAHAFVLEGSGSSAQGDATLRITGEASEDGSSTTVHLHSRIELTGRIAQLGSSMAPEVVGRLLDQFVVNMTASLEGGPDADAVAAPQSAPSSPATARPAGDSADTFDLGGSMLPALGGRAVVGAAIALTVGVGLVAALRSRRRPVTLVVVPILLPDERHRG